MDAVAASLWEGVATSSVAWTGQNRWHRNSVAYICVSSWDAEAGVAWARLLDPSIPHQLGSPVDQRTLIDLGIEIRVGGNLASKLSQQSVYVIYEAAPPVKYTDKLYNIEIPRCGSKAGISRMLGAVLPWTLGSQGSQEVAITELFSGGLGGWTQLIHQAEGFKTVCAVDYDRAVTPWFASNNGAVEVTSDHGDFGVHDGRCGFPVICADVGDWAWLRIFLDVDCQVFTASFPCGPWSTLGRQRALNHNEGEAILSCLKLVRLLQPAAICFENVAGFHSSPHYGAFLRQLHLAGFRLVFSHVHDLRELSYTTRRRWLAIAVNTLYIKDPDMPIAIPDRFKRRLTFDPKSHTLANLGEILKQELQVTAYEDEILRKYQGNAKVMKEGSVLPTITASYRASLDFPKEMLASRGLFAWLLDEGDKQARWCSPFEALRALGFANFTAIPEHTELAMKIIGNAISPYHAAVVIAKLSGFLVNLTGSKHEVQLQNLVKSIDMQLDGFRDLQVISTGGTRFLCQQCEPEPAQHASLSCSGVWDADVPTAKRTRVDYQQGSISHDSDSAVDDTQTFVTCIQGWPLSSGSSGVVDTMGRFFLLRQPLTPTSWSTWFQDQYPAVPLDNVVATSQGNPLDDACLCLPGYRYVVHLFKVLPGNDPCEVCGLYDPNGKFHALRPPSHKTSWQNWVFQVLGEASFSLTATIDGKPIPFGQLVTPKSLILDPDSKVERRTHVGNWHSCWS